MTGTVDPSALHPLSQVGMRGGHMPPPPRPPVYASQSSGATVQHPPQHNTGLGGQQHGCMQQQHAATPPGLHGGSQQQQQTHQTLTPVQYVQGRSSSESQAPQHRHPQHQQQYLPVMQQRQPQQQQQQLQQQQHGQPGGYQQQQQHGRGMGGAYYPADGLLTDADVPELTESLASSLASGDRGYSNFPDIIQDDLAAVLKPPTSDSTARTLLPIAAAREQGKSEGASRGPVSLSQPFVVPTSTAPLSGFIVRAGNLHVAKGDVKTPVVTGAKPLQHGKDRSPSMGGVAAVLTPASGDGVSCLNLLTLAAAQPKMLAGGPMLVYVSGSAVASNPPATSESQKGSDCPQKRRRGRPPKKQIEANQKQRTLIPKPPSGVTPSPGVPFLMNLGGKGIQLSQATVTSMPSAAAAPVTVSIAPRPNEDAQSPDSGMASSQDSPVGSFTPEVSSNNAISTTSGAGTVCSSGTPVFTLARPSVATSCSSTQNTVVLPQNLANLGNLGNLGNTTTIIFSPSATPQTIILKPGQVVNQSGSSSVLPLPVVSPKQPVPPNNVINLLGSVGSRLPAHPVQTPNRSQTQMQSETCEVKVATQQQLQQVNSGFGANVPQHQQQQHVRGNVAPSTISFLSSSHADTSSTPAPPAQMNNLVTQFKSSSLAPQYPSLLEELCSPGLDPDDLPPLPPAPISSHNQQPEAPRVGPLPPLSTAILPGAQQRPLVSPGSHQVLGSLSNLSPGRGAIALYSVPSTPPRAQAGVAVAHTYSPPKANWSYGSGAQMGQPMMDMAAASAHGQQQQHQQQQQQQQPQQQQHQQQQQQGYAPSVSQPCLTQSLSSPPLRGQPQAGFSNNAGLLQQQQPQYQSQTLLLTQAQNQNSSSQWCPQNVNATNGYATNSFSLPVTASSFSNVYSNSAKPDLSTSMNSSLVYSQCSSTFPVDNTQVPYHASSSHVAKQQTSSCSTNNSFSYQTSPPISVVPAPPSSYSFTSLTTSSSMFPMESHAPIASSTTSAQQSESQGTGVGVEGTSTDFKPDAASVKDKSTLLKRIRARKSRNVTKRARQRPLRRKARPPVKPKEAPRKTTACMETQTECCIPVDVNLPYGAIDGDVAQTKAVLDSQPPKRSVSQQRDGEPDSTTDLPDQSDGSGYIFGQTEAPLIPPPTSKTLESLKPSRSNGFMFGEPASLSSDISKTISSSTLKPAVPEISVFRAVSSRSSKSSSLTSCGEPVKGHKEQQSNFPSLLSTSSQAGTDQGQFDDDYEDEGPEHSEGKYGEEEKQKETKKKRKAVVHWTMKPQGWSRRAKKSRKNQIQANKLKRQELEHTFQTSQKTTAQQTTTKQRRPSRDSSGDTERSGPESSSLFVAESCGITSGSFDFASSGASEMSSAFAGVDCGGAKAKDLKRRRKKHLGVQKSKHSGVQDPVVESELHQMMRSFDQLRLSELGSSCSMLLLLDSSNLRQNSPYRDVKNQTSDASSDFEDSEFALDSASLPPDNSPPEKPVKEVTRKKTIVKKSQSSCPRMYSRMVVGTRPSVSYSSSLSSPSPAPVKLTATEAPAPKKRGRGRPRKYPIVRAPPDNNALPFAPAHHITDAIDSVVQRFTADMDGNHVTGHHGNAGAGRGRGLVKRGRPSSVDLLRMVTSVLGPHMVYVGRHTPAQTAAGDGGAAANVVRTREGQAAQRLLQLAKHSGRGRKKAVAANPQRARKPARAPKPRTGPVASAPSATGVASGLDPPPKRKPGRPRKYPRPLEAAPESDIAPQQSQLGGFEGGVAADADADLGGVPGGSRDAKARRLLYNPPGRRGPAKPMKIFKKGRASLSDACHNRATSTSVTAQASVQHQAQVPAEVIKQDPVLLAERKSEAVKSFTKSESKTSFLAVEKVNMEGDVSTCGTSGKVEEKDGVTASFLADTLDACDPSCSGLDLPEPIDDTSDALPPSPPPARRPGRRPKKNRRGGKIPSRVNPSRGKSDGRVKSLSERASKFMGDHKKWKNFLSRGVVVRSGEDGGEGGKDKANLRQHLKRHRKKFKLSRIKKGSSYQQRGYLEPPGVDTQVQQQLPPAAGGEGGSAVAYSALLPSPSPKRGRGRPRKYPLPPPPPPPPVVLGDPLDSTPQEYAAAAKSVGVDASLEPPAAKRARCTDEREGEEEVQRRVPTPVSVDSPASTAVALAEPLTPRSRSSTPVAALGGGKGAVVRLLKSMSLRKRYQRCGLFSDTYKEDIPKKTSTSSTNTNGGGVATSGASGCVGGGSAVEFSRAAFPHGLLPQPCYVFKSIVCQQLDNFLLPHDIWLAHSAGLLGEADEVTKYKKIRSNIYVGMSAPVAEREEQTTVCSCTVPGDDPQAHGCTPAHDCINRQLYMECTEESCGLGDRCDNRPIQRKQWLTHLSVIRTEQRGLGVITTQTIKKGQFILEYVGEVVSEREFRRRMAEEYSRLKHHYCLNLSGGAVIDGTKSANIGRFVNHSCSPNCSMEKWNIDRACHMGLYATQDMEAGTELTYFYNLVAFCNEWQQECRCGALSCRGFIGPPPRSAQPKRPLAPEPGTKAKTKPGRKKKKPVAVVGGGCEAPRLSTIPPSILSPQERAIATELRLFLLRNLRRALVQEQGAHLLQRHVEDNASAGASKGSGNQGVSGRAGNKGESKICPDRLAYILTRIYSRIANCSDRGEQIAEPLQRVPTREENPYFYRVVKEPIDLQTVKRKIDTHRYGSFGEFDHDIKRLFKNVVLCSGKSSRYGKIVTKLMAVYTPAREDAKVMLRDAQRDYRARKTSKGGGRGGVREERQEAAAVVPGTPPDTPGAPPKAAALDVAPPTSSVPPPSSLSSSLSGAQKNQREEEDFIRCICGVCVDEGWMIECDKCHIWQHLECVGVERETESYLCETCEPRDIPDELPTVEQRDKHNTTYITLLRDDLKVAIGECVYLDRAKCEEKRGAEEAEALPVFGPPQLDVFRVEGLRKNKRGEKHVIGRFYKWPHEVKYTYLRPFYRKEVVLEPEHYIIPLRAVYSKCCVLDPESFTQGQPVTFGKEDIYVCELQLGPRHDKVLRSQISRLKEFPKVNKAQYCFRHYPEKRPLDGCGSLAPSEEKVEKKEEVQTTLPSDPTTTRQAQAPSTTICQAPTITSQAPTTTCQRRQSHKPALERRRRKQREALPHVIERLRSTLPPSRAPLDATKLFPPPS